MLHQSQNALLVLVSAALLWTTGAVAQGDDEDLPIEDDVVSAPAPPKAFGVRQVWTAAPGEHSIALSVHGDTVVVGTDAGGLHRSTDRGQTFAGQTFGQSVWMPPFAAAPRSALNIVLGTSVVIPGRTPAADLIRRPPPTRARRPFVAPQAASQGLYQITNFGRLGTGLWLSYGTDRMFFYHTPAALLNFDNETGAAFLEEGGTNMDSPAFWSSPWVRGLPRADFWWFESTDRVEYDGDVRQARHISRALLFNPDLPHGQTTLLSTRNGEDIAVSAQGVFVSTDGGETFGPVFAPTEPCCSDAALVDEDGTQTLVVVGRRTVFTSVAPFTAFVPRAALDEDGHAPLIDDAMATALVVAADGSAAWLLRSGKQGAASSLAKVAGTPTEEMFVVAKDGLRQVEGDALAKVDDAPMIDLVIERANGQMMGAAGERVFVGGRDPTTWNVIATLPAPVIALKEDERGRLYAVTAKALYALDGDDVAPRVSTAGIRRAKAARALDPPLDIVLAAAARRMVPRMDSRVHLAGLMPQFQVSVIGIGATAVADLNAGFLDYAINGGRAAAGDVDRAVGESEEATFIKTRSYFDVAVSGFASWDLPEIVAHNAMPRRVREAKKAFDKVEREIVSLYLARRDLRDRLVAAPPTSATAREQLALDVDELTARLDALCGGSTFVGVKRYAASDKSGEEAAAIAERAATASFVDEDALRSRKFRASIKGVLPSAEIYVRGTWSRLVEPTYNLELLNDEIPWIDRIAEGAIVDTRLSLVWDLPRLVFNTEELDVYRMVHVKRLVTEHALKTHFALRKLQAQDAGGDDLAIVLHSLRREEMSRKLDAILGVEPNAESTRSAR